MSPSCALASASSRRHALSWLDARKVNFAARQTRHTRFQQLLAVLGVVRRFEVIAGNQQHLFARIGAEF